MNRMLRALGAAATISLVMTLPAVAENGVTENEVMFAQVAALSGDAAALGTGMREGIEAAFAEANAAGGVHGRKLVLEAFDDGYEPGQSVDRVREVIEGGQHFALIGSVGTPTTAATQPMATDAGVPLIGPFTGAGFLRNPDLGNVYNFRATYGAETEAWIAHLVDDLQMKDIAILYQGDGFGRVGLDGVTQALERRGMTLSAQATYVRNTIAVKGALLDLRKADPDAVVMVGAYKPIAEFIKVARQLDFDATFVNISFVGSEALANALGADGEGVIISQVVPFPWDESTPAVAAYQKALAATKPDASFGFVTLEGYLVGRLAVAALEKAGADLDRASYLRAFEQLAEIDLGGVTLQFGPGDNQGMDEVFLTQIRSDGTFSVIEPASVASLAN